MLAAKRDRDRLRAERRQERRALLESGPPSPCIAICEYDEQAGWCRGCYRTLDEIREWPILLPADRQAVLDRCRDRRGSVIPPVSA